jgi:coenzyme F420-reducing hydrogenase delta subunit
MLALRDFLTVPGRVPGEAVVVCCTHGAARFSADITAARAVPYPIDCAGNLHTSVVELLLRAGAAGVLILACPPRDCRHREGPRWLGARVYEGREAELQPRVDRARIAIAAANGSERRRAVEAVRAFVAAVAALGPPVAAEAPGVDERCVPTLVEEGR